ncbi:AsmA family protein [Methylonatrum kenyense]|uniref:AsmA family protein n=1 Tax=Methylonatrum kenyense TaxID=455253 RepID=UPI0020BFAF73|nr:AsmA family protein [Methylonatrum kenyense]MCK8516699.1 AsmA family protein [Methylonatrum kenyense]
MKIVKWLLIVLVLVVVLLVGAAVAVIALVDPNDYRDDISRLVKENTGQELVIEGDISLSFFPWLGLELGRTRLENREGFGDQPFIQIENAGVAVQLLPLLRRELVVDVVRLDGLLVHLVVNEDGEANWELDLPEDPDDVVTEAPEDEAPRDEDRDRSPPLQIGRLDGIEISEMRVIHEDRQAGTRQEAGPVDLSVGSLDFDTDIPVAASWVVLLDDDTRIEGELDLHLRADRAFEKFRAHVRQLELTAFAEGLPSSGVRSRLSTLIEADLEADTASLSDLRLEALGLRLDAEAQATNLRDGPRASGRFKVPEGNLREALERAGQDLPDGMADDALTAFRAEGAFSLVDDALDLEGFMVRLDGAELDLDLVARGVPDAPTAEGRYELRNLNLRHLLEGAGQEMPEDMHEDALSVLNSSGDFRYGDDSLRLSDVNLAVDNDIRLDLAATVEALTGEPRAEGRFELAELNLRTLLDRLGQEVPVTADDEVLTSFRTEGRFRYGGDSAEVQDLVLELDETSLQGSVSVRELDDPMIGFQLRGNRFNADRYLPPDSDEEPADNGTRNGDNGEVEPVELPMEMLRALRLDGSFRLDQFIINDLTFSDVNFTVEADGGRIRVHPIGARLYGGEYSGDIRIDATGDEAEISVNERIRDVQVRELVQRVMERDFLEGVGSFSIEGTTRGLKVDDLVTGLSGESEFDFRDGAVIGFNLAQMVRNATARLRGESTSDDVPQQTDFSELSGRLLFDEGRINNERLNASSPLFRVEGGGIADLNEESIDYNLVVNLVGTLTGQGGQSLDELRRLPIPLRISGSLADPSIRLDLQAALGGQSLDRLREEQEALRERARDAEGDARERIERERERLQERGREEVEDRLRGLFR